MSNKLFYPICLALVLVLAGFAQAELLVNPGFEAGLDSWKTWGGGSGSGAGGWFYNSDAHTTVMEDGTAHGGNVYVETGIADMAGSWWAVSLVFQEHPVTEGQTYQISAWFRDGDADGTPSLIASGGMLQWEWRDAAPIGDPNTDERGELVERVDHSFDLTEEWTYVSATEVAPPGAMGATVLFGTTWGGINLDVDDVSYVEVVPPVVSPYVTSTDQGGLIPIINRDFSEPNDGKHTAFDIEASRKQDEPFLGYMTTDVPGWTTDVSVKDSGIELGDDPNYGYSAFLLGGYDEWADDPNWIEPSVWQILGYKIQEGDQFRLAVDAKHIWTNGVPVELKMGLFYVDINGSRQELASLIVDMTDAWDWATYVLDVPELPEAAVGKILGIELQNIAERSSWIHVDNVSLIDE